MGGEHWIPAGRVTHLGSQQQNLRTRAGFQWGGGAVPALYSQGTAHSWASTGSSGAARDLVLPGGSPGAIRAIPRPNTRPPRQVWQPSESGRFRWAMRCARQATRIISQGRDDPLGGCYHHTHFPHGTVEARGKGQTWKGERGAWSSAAKVLASSDLRERGQLGSLAARPGWQQASSASCRGGGKGGQQANRSREPEAAALGGAAGEVRSAGDNVGPSRGALLPSEASRPPPRLPSPGLVQPQLRHSGHCLPGPSGGAPGPEARSVACREIYTRLLTATRHRRRVLGPGWSAVNRPPVSR